MDLNLLAAFVSIYETRSVTKAAKAARVTQPAMSHTLKRLRETFNDELFVPNGRTFDATIRADELYAPVKEALSGLELAWHEGQEFDPASAQVCFEIAMPVDAELLCLPKIGRELRKVAPNASFRVVNVVGLEIRDTLGQLDLVIPHTDEEFVPLSCHRQVLWQDDWVTICAEGHPRIGNQLSLEAFLKEGHVIVGSTCGRVAHVDKVLAIKGLERQVGHTTGFFFSAARIAAESDLLVTLPRRLAELYSKEMQMKILTPPIELPAFDVPAIWAPQKHHCPAHKWFRRWLKELLENP